MRYTMWQLRDLIDELLEAKVKTTLFGGDRLPRLGRLVLQERIGAGAMGTVFAAYDPRLERKVAVKVLHVIEDRERVLAEARSLAKLAHPNVVAVHDADEVDGLVYIVMELVDGTPLRTWMAGRGWPEIVRVMREAGAGIAAAHAAGLVHRDIKPDNILIAHDRARVVDFGLAAPHAEHDGSKAGTPLYMAPEVVAGGKPTEASDQFSFAITLYEAVTGERPPAVTPPPRGKVPAWLHAIIARAMAADPSARFGSMTELVAALRRDRRRGRRYAIAGTTLAAGAIFGALAFRGHSAGDTCGGGAARASAVWNDQVRGSLRTALGNAPWTTQTLALFDEHANAWQASYRHVCEASRVRGEQSDTLLDLRMRCLDRALERFGALATTLAAGSLDAATRAAAPNAVGELGPAETCETLTEPGELAMPADRHQRELVIAAEHDLDRAWALFVLGRYKEARPVLQGVERAIAGVAAPRVRAAVLSLASSVEARIGDPAIARARLDEALVAAAGAKAPELELEVWSRRLRSELFSGDPAKVLEWATFARAAAKRAGRDGAEIDGIVAQALRNAGKLDESRALLDKALASKDPLRADQRALLEMNRGSLDLAFGDSRAALVLFTQARDRVLAALGDHHPDLAIYEDKLAAAKRARGLEREALKLHDHSIELRRAAFGDGDRALATGLIYRAQTRLEVGDLDGARGDLEAARKIREQAFGATSVRVGEVVALIGDVKAAAGDTDTAGVLYDQAAKLDARIELAPRLYAIGRPVEAAAIEPLATGETLSIDRANALAVRVALLAKSGQADAATALATALHARYRPALDAALGAAIGEALLAAGDRTRAADVLGKTAAALGNEPTRTALRVFIGLAHSSADPAQAARAAVAVYQALPRLARSAFDEMWKLAKMAP